MKKIAYLLMCILLVSCGNENKAKKLVEDYLNKNLDDPEKYESVSWGELESIDSIIKYDFRYGMYISNIETNEQRIKDIAPLLKVYEDRKDSISSNYKELILLKEEQTRRYESAKRDLAGFIRDYPYTNGWAIEHSYRTPNKLGALELRKETFYISKDFSKIINR